MKNWIALILIFSTAACSHSMKKETDGIRTTVKTAIPKIQECYQTGLKENPQIKGKLVSHFEVNDQGKVTKCESKKSDLNNPAVESCICNRISSLQFAAAPTGRLMDVNYPFYFAAPEKQTEKSAEKPQDKPAEKQPENQPEKKSE